MKLKITILVLSLALAGCSTTSSIYNKKLKKLAPTMIKMYVEGNGCKENFSTEIIGNLPKTLNDKKLQAKEHWRIDACGKVHDLELTLSKDGRSVETKKLM